MVNGDDKSAEEVLPLDSSWPELLIDNVDKVSEHP